MLDYALAYARNGWKVFPLAVKDKVPLIKDGRGCLDATTEREQILKWWAKCPSANIGIATGESFFVLDIDPKNNGNLWLETVELPDTIQQQTGSGGTHYLFSGPPDIPNSAGKIAPGVDIRGAGGYIVAPPSVHPNGNRYTWLDCEEIPTDPPALSPVWLLNAAGEQKKNGMPPVSEVIPKGVQHDTLFRYVCSMWGGKTKFTEAEVMAATIILSKRCEEVPPEKNVEKIVHSVTRKYEPGLSPEYAAKVKVEEEAKPEAPEEDTISADWHELLHKDGKGKPKPVLINADIALRYSPEWAGVLVFDEFKHKVMIVKDPPIVASKGDTWTDEYNTRAAVWMQANGIYVGSECVGSAVYAIARETSIHPVRDYLVGLKWDGTPRVESWLRRYMGVDPEHNKQKVYIDQIGKMWLISAVARIMQPGCKVDHMLVLEGPQGTKKSTALSILAGPDYFCDSMPDISSKDASMQTAGSWIIEWSELDAMRRAETTAVKAFVTRQTEKIRPPYGKHIVEFHRQCVFAGTTNKDDYLCDETGNRRFWPAKCTQVDTDALRRDRDQLWAEAMFLYNEGQIWWFATAEEASQGVKEQEDRVEIDPWREKIKEYVDRNELQPNFSCEEILDVALKLDTSRQTIVEKRRVGRVMRDLGLVYKTTRDGDATIKRFCRT